MLKGKKFDAFALFALDKSLFKDFECPFRAFECPFRAFECPFRAFECPFKAFERRFMRCLATISWVTDNHFLIIKNLI